MKLDSALLTRIAAQMSIRFEEHGIGGGMSGSRLRFVSRADGTRCVLKVTGLDHQGARREFDFYHMLADQVPVRTPQLLDCYEGDGVIAMLITAHRMPIPPASWESRWWTRLAVELACLHETHVSNPEEWRPNGSPVADIGNPNHDLIENFWRDDQATVLEPLLAERGNLQQQILLADECFVHGDFHTENILHDSDSLIWIDWQSSGIGNPARELAFLQARMNPSGTILPTEFLTTYCCERGLDETQLRRSVLAAELAILLFEWPTYAGYNPAERNNRVRNRVRYLASEWFG